MTEHDQRVCPRCGVPAGDSRFCASCRGHIESLTGIPARAAAHPAEADPALQSPAEAVRLEQALVRLEQAMAAASRMSGERVAGSAPPAALEVDAVPPRTAAGNAQSAGVVEVTKLPPSTSDRGSQARHTPRDVARLEDVLTVASPPRQDTVEDVQPQIDPEPSYVDAQTLREAFWFEQASARQAIADAVAAVLAGTEPTVAETTASVAPPAADVEPETASVAPPLAAVDPQAASVPPPLAAVEPQAASVPPPLPSPDTTPSVVRSWAEPSSTNHWATALCLFALIALLVLLTGRGPRRLGGQKHS